MNGPKGSLPPLLYNLPFMEIVIIFLTLRTEGMRVYNLSKRFLIYTYKTTPRSLPFNPDKIGEVSEGQIFCEEQRLHSYEFYEY